MVIQPEFKYYQNYEFHKLNQSLNIDKNFSFMHTNICSISGNTGKLETLLSNLEHNFDVLKVIMLLMVTKLFMALVGNH